MFSGPIAAASSSRLITAHGPLMTPGDSIGVPYWSQARPSGKVKMRLIMPAAASSSLGLISSMHRRRLLFSETIIRSLPGFRSRSFSRHSN